MGHEHPRHALRSGKACGFAGFPYVVVVHE